MEQQIDKDIQRCHTYDIILSTSIKQKYIKNIIYYYLYLSRANVYWQGLHSIVAIFVRICEDEYIAAALVCVSIISYSFFYSSMLLIINHSFLLYIFIILFYSNL